ncbi:MAG: hypothetical protein Q4B60_08125 [Erysipelotrichaceae bacterium]|nr:hypothetical protein [Erysipelotrichaceae bacterium]
MKDFLNKFKSKTKSKSGMSLGETLVAVLIILLVSLSLASTMSLAANQYVKTKRKLEANILMSSLCTIVSDELGYATSVKLDSSNNVVSFIGNNYLTDKYTGKLASLNGRLAYVNIDNNNEFIELLAKSAYSNGMKVEMQEPKYNSANNTYKVTIYIKDPGDKPLISKTFDVININGVPEYAS